MSAWIFKITEGIDQGKVVRINSEDPFTAEKQFTEMYPDAVFEMHQDHTQTLKNDISRIIGNKLHGKKWNT